MYLIKMIAKKFLVCILISLQFSLLAACSLQQDNHLTATSKQEARYLDGELVRINSDNVSLAGYKKSTRTLTVVFSNGSTYEYYQVSESLWIKFLDAQPHPWSKIGYPILVQGGYSYARVG